MNENPVKLLISALSCAGLLFSGCENLREKDSHAEMKETITASTPQPLPHFGEFDIEFQKSDDQTMKADTVYYAIPKFAFTNQDGKEITYKDYQNYITIADFFFTECPSICPAMSAQMVRIQEKLKLSGYQPQVKLLSHSVKPDHDTPEVLKAYGEKLGADFSNWNFVTGKAEDIYELAEEGYLLSAFPSDTAEGGIFHTDKVTLLDRDMHIRGYYDGTSTASMDKLFDDIQKLIKDESQNDVATRSEEK